MKSPYIALMLAFVAIIVTACSSPTADQSVPSTGDQSIQSGRVFGPTWDQAPQTDGQGAVIVEVTPLNLNAQDDTLEFEIALNTHSVNLSMDLVQLVTLTTDTGTVVQATGWDAPRGGHHISGKLIFPSFVNGNPVLDGATKIILQLRDVDVPLRNFEWQLQ